MSLGVLFLENVTFLIGTVILRNLARKQSKNVRHDKEVYEAFADMYSRSVFIDSTRFFTEVFLIAVATIVIYCTISYWKFADISSFLGLFSGISVVLCVVVDEIFVLRQWCLNNDFCRINDKKINFIYWRLCLDNTVKNNRKFPAIKTPNELENKLTFTKKHFTGFWRANQLSKYLYQCPHCKAESRLGFSGNVITCSSCGKQWGVSVNGNLVGINGESTVKTTDDWINFQRTEMKRKTTENEFEYSYSVKGSLSVFLDGRRWVKLGEGTLYQYSDSFVFLWDNDGLRRDLNAEVKGFIPFSFGRGMYFNDGTLTYRFKTQDKAKYVEINDSLVALEKKAENG